MLPFANDPSGIVPHLGTILAALGVAFAGLASWIAWLTRQQIEESKVIRKEIREIHDTAVTAQREQRDHFDKILNEVRAESSRTIDATRIEFRGALKSVIDHCEAESKDQAGTYQKMIDTVMKITGIRNTSTSASDNKN